MDAQLDVRRLPQQPNAAPAPAEGEPAATPPAAAEEPAAAAPGAKGSVFQMGFFDNRAQAERAWSALSARFPSLRGMNKMVIPHDGGMRLRAGAASPEQAREMCRALQAGGENCFVVN
jgi:cell division septation protein DedD